MKLAQRSMLFMRSYHRIHKILSGPKIYPAENNLPLIEYLKTNGLVGSSSPHSPTLTASSYGPVDKIHISFLFFWFRVFQTNTFTLTFQIINQIE